MAPIKPAGHNGWPRGPARSGRSGAPQAANAAWARRRPVV